MKIEAGSHLYKCWRKAEISGVSVSLNDSDLVLLKVSLLRFLTEPEELFGTAEMPRKILLTSKLLSNDEKTWWVLDDTITCIHHSYMQ